MSSADAELTLAAKEAIRLYLRRAVLLPGGLLAVIAALGAGVAGFLINDIAVQQGQIEAYKDASGAIMTVMSDIATKSADVVNELKDHSTTARNVANEAEKAQERFALLESGAQDTVQSIEDMNNALANLQIPSNLEALYDELAAQLVRNPEFRAKVGGDLNTRVTKLESQWSKLRSPAQARTVVIDGGGSWGKWYDASCPVNQYVCGLGQKVEPQQGRDDDTAMNAVRFQCCPVFQ